MREIKIPQEDLEELRLAARQFQQYFNRLLGSIVRFQTTLEGLLDNYGHDPADATNSSEGGDING